VSRASDRAGSAPNKIARKLIASFRIAANRGNAMQTRYPRPSAQSILVFVINFSE